MSVLTLDLETTIKESYKRKANRFDTDNYIVIWGLKYGDDPVKSLYMREPEEGWLDGVKMIVAHNAGFDMLWIWDRPEVREWLKNGGKIFCTQYAEYLLTGQQSTWASLDECAEKYGGVLKNDEIKTMWEAGIDTPDIPKDMLMDYADTDVENTYLIFKKQVASARKQGMINTLHTHMEALLGLIEMEYNGLYIDQKTAEVQRKQLAKDLDDVIKGMSSFIPNNLPEELEWNWGSKNHLSALLFGGKVKYRKRVHKRDEDGNLMYTKKKETWYLLDGEPINPEDVTDTSILDTYKGGKKAGKIKTKQVDVQGEPKMRYEDFFFDIEGVTIPHADWKTKIEGVFATNDDVLTVLQEKKIPVVEKLFLWRKYDKDLGTYYKRYDPKKKCDVGMLTLVQPDGIIHHMLNNVATVTGRLSSSNPNLQNIPRKDKSEIKKVFSSRFGEDGRMGEVDFSQLEVIIQGLLSKDPQLLADILDGVCFHCKRAATKLREDYEEVYRKAKVDHVQEYVDIRQDSKEFSFKKAYGAGVISIAASTGMPIEEVQAYIKAEDEMYSGVVDFNARMTAEINSSRIVTTQTINVKGIDYNLGRGQFLAPTGKRYVFTEEESPKFLQEPRNKKQKPIFVSFNPAKIKNYSVQGTAGEIVLLCLGVLFRKFLANDNFGGKAFLVNTVHDCFWVDAHKDVAVEAIKLVQEVLESANKLFEERYKIDCPVVFRVESEVGKTMYDLVELPKYIEESRV